jgi:predicted SAM-dependent methyltransferase
MLHDPSWRERSELHEASGVWESGHVKALLRRILPREVRVLLKKIFYFGFKLRCPVCRSRVRKYLAEGRDVPVLRELDVVGGEYHPGYECPICRSHARSRLVMFYLERETDIFRRGTRLLHLAPEIGIGGVLASADTIEYRPCDLNPENYVFADDIVKMDATNIAFEDQTFDVVLANHVLEHIEDDARAASELHRVLKPGGWAILQVPIAMKLDETREDPGMTSPEERERAFGQRDHVRLYARDYKDRLESHGFAVELYDVSQRHGAEVVDRFMLNPREKLYLARKAL